MNYQTWNDKTFRLRIFRTNQMFDMINILWYSSTKTLHKNIEQPMVFTSGGCNPFALIHQVENIWRKVWVETVSSAEIFSFAHLQQRRNLFMSFRPFSKRWCHFTLGLPQYFLILFQVISAHPSHISKVVFLDKILCRFFLFVIVWFNI